MESFFGIPTSRLAVATLVLLGAVLAFLGLQAWRRPIFLRLGLRQLPRRPQQTALIVAGLMLSTALVTTSLATGDTLAHALRGAAVTELGRLDELVTFSVTRPALGVTGGSADVAPTATFFPIEVVLRVQRRLRQDPSLRQDVVGAAPVISLDCTLLDLTSRQTAAASVRALPANYDPVFGELVSLSGEPLSLAQLQPGQVFVNEAALGALSVQAGDELSCTLQGVPHQWRVAAVAAARGLGAGLGVTVLLPLAHAQDSLRPAGAAGHINQIWIANRGDAITGAARTERVIEALRPALVDVRALYELRRLLARGDLRAALAARRGNLPERTQEGLSELLRLVDQAANDQALDRALRSQAVRSAVVTAARDTRDQALVESLVGALQRATGFQVFPIKQQVLELADRAGNVITTIFLLFSLLSIAAGLLLVFLIFTLLAASRRSELGITRALGTERGHLVAMFTFEGVAYGLLAATVGVPVGLGLSRLLLSLLIWAVERGAAGFTDVAGRVAQTVTWHVEPASVIVAAGAGLLLTVATVVGSAWQVTRITIASAIRDLPEPAAKPRGLGAWGWLGLFPAGAGLLALGLSWRETLPFATGVSCLLLGGGVAAGLLAARVWGRPVGERLGATVAGGLLAGYWSLPFDAQRWIGLPRLSSGIEIFGLAAVMMVGGAAWALSANGELTLRLGMRFLTAIGRPAPAVRLAGAHLLRDPFRTGLTTTMFGLVVFTLTVMQVITAAAVNFQATPYIAYGGWHLQGSLSSRPESDRPPEAESGRRGSELEGDRPPGVAAPLELAPAADEPAGGSRSPEAVATAAIQEPALEAYVAAAGVRTAAFFALTQLSAPSPSWGGYAVSAIDSGFARGNHISLQTRARGYGSDRQVWEAVARDMRLAVIDASALPSPQLQGRTNLSMLSFSLHGVRDDQRVMEPLPVWIGNPGGSARKVSVIGIIDRRASNHFRGLFVAPELFQSLGRPIRPAVSRIYFQLKPEVNINEARAALGETFFADGLQTVNLVERFQNQSGPLLLASRLLELFVSLGLFVGIAALSVISSRAALERRQEIGVLRAIGLSRAGVAGSLLFESTLVVLLGGALGVVLGLVLCRNVFEVQFFDRYQQGLKLVIPWTELLVTVALTSGAALLATWIPARHASRIPPIAAIRQD